MLEYIVVKGTVVVVLQSVGGLSGLAIAVSGRRSRLRHSMVNCTAPGYNLSRFTVIGIYFIIPRLFTCVYYRFPFLSFLQHKVIFLWNFNNILFNGHHLNRLASAVPPCPWQGQVRNQGSLWCRCCGWTAWWWSCQSSRWRPDSWRGQYLYGSLLYSVFRCLKWVFLLSFSWRLLGCVRHINSYKFTKIWYTV